MKHMMIYDDRHKNPKRSSCWATKLGDARVLGATVHETAPKNNDTLFAG